MLGSWSPALGLRDRLTGAYIREQTVVDGQDNCPGAVAYKREGDKVLRFNACVFGPGDLYCSLWSLRSAYFALLVGVNKRVPFA